MSNGKIVLKGKIKLISPLIIGSGDNDFSDLDVIKNREGIPYIPATSFTGVLRHNIKGIEIDNDKLKSFWGFSEGDNTIGSSANCSDLTLINTSNIVIRDGVRIDNKNGRAKDKGKYDYELVEPGGEFNLKLIADYKDEEHKEFAKKMIGTITEVLSNKKISIGAKTNSGFGKIELSEYKLFDYDFIDKKNVLSWLSNKDPDSSIVITEKFNIEQKLFTIDAYFDLKTSLIIKSYPTDSKKPDAVHIKSNGKNVIPGTSIKGAVRSRAERIWNTKFGENNHTEKFNKLFGFVNENDPKSRAVKSKLRIEESVLDPDKFAEEIQARIKIDRFTGGTMSGALFDSMPLYRKDKNEKEKIINVKMTVNNYEDYEIGLLLLVLKDLWTGDLPLGGEKNVGRGVLEGVSAEINDGNGLSLIFENPIDLTDSDKEKLQNYVNELNKMEKNSNGK